MAAAGTAQAGSIQDTVRAALETSPDVGVVKADRHAVEQELRQARAGYLPSIDVRGAIGPEVVNNANTRDRPQRGPGDPESTDLITKQSQIKLSQMLFDGFAVRSEVQRQTARLDSAAYRVQEAADFVAVDAVEQHLEVLRNQRLVKLAEDNLKTHQRLLGQVRELERRGAGDVADVQQATARVANAQADLEQARGHLADAGARYEKIVGEKPVALQDEPAPVAALPKGVEPAAAEASVHSPTVQIATSDVDVAAAELRGARANYYPKLDVELNGFAGDDVDGQDGKDLQANALLVLKYNLFRGGADMAHEREAFHRINEARASLVKARRKAEEEARLSYNALDTARARTVSLRAKAEAQRRTRDAYASQFQIGQRSLLDLLDSENELFLARSDLVTAEYTERFAVYRVLGVVGDLISTLDISPPHETIDIYRQPGDVHTPGSIDRKSQPLSDPKAEPRPLRGIPAGEPPPDRLDASTAINTPPAR